MSELLLPKVASGQKEAMRECVDRFSPRIWTLAVRMLRNATDAEDAVQEIFLELWKCAGHYNSERGSELTFVMILARRRLIDYRRRHYRDYPVMLAADRPDSGNCPLEPLSTLEEAALAQTMLNTLTSDQRRVLDLSIQEGLSHQQIAEVMQLPLGTVKTTIRRGLIRVRELLANRDAGGHDAA